MRLPKSNLIQAADGSWPATEAEIQQATTFINRVLTTDSVRIPPEVVIDVGIIAGVGWAVIESNPAWASGIYGCDPHKVLDVLQRACIPCHSITATESEWLPNRNS
ncbi:ATP-grasp domain-containing protein [Vacuolonema iberomarrocanum]|uniref:ATP-grasp domain-containing protein n=1 Tax=Vacuolonema iberomarrocanum TaxID=3454632 RepID=UPI0019E6F580|nr:ATP-grasp domain-containing protein [filamentous cyanobacterium LEGE 07170]